MPGIIELGSYAQQIISGSLSLQLDNRVGYQPRWDVWGRFTQVRRPILLLPVLGRC